MTKQLVQVEGKSLKLSNLDKVLWPKLSLTKADLLAYHAKLYAISQEHWQGRALTVTRYPHGVEGKFFYQKNIPASAPPWVVSHKVDDTDYVVAGDLATISWLVNSAAIELHPSTYLTSRPSVPSYAIIDLDPTLPQGYAEAVQIGKHCRDVLGEMGLRSYAKLSGATGLHIYIPLEGHYDFKITAQLVKVVGMTLKRRFPQKVTLERLIKNRHGVYVDYLQNHPGKTIVGVYSPRPTPEATVSTPVHWDDLDYYVPQDFTLQTVPDWVRERGDLFRPVLTEPQSLENLLERGVFQE
jgi:bifunctional non-homologous end joining protein LigD